MSERIEEIRERLEDGSAGPWEGAIYELLAEVERLRAKNAELNKRAQDAESNRTAKYDRWCALGTTLLVVRGRQKELEKHLDWWEKQGYSTVCIDWLRRHFGIKR